ncbi:KR domain-containing protein [Dendryphion nanum]|uniref:KR domain-containing protein n=1 Tax=Dendryphion nanum TaxID=256645 RepID=A0A9P9J291_9PLEO|nr:KR domain-containing protein [Dendryphion nanum]
MSHSPSRPGLLVSAGLCCPSRIDPGCYSDMVPVCFRDIWISNDIATASNLGKLNAHTTAQKVGLRQVDASLVAGNISNSRPLITARASMRVLDSIRPPVREDRDQTRQFNKIEYHPDVALLDDARKLNLPQRDKSSHPCVLDMELRKEWLCIATIGIVIANLPSSYMASTPHILRYVDWMKMQLLSSQQSLERFKHTQQYWESDPESFIRSVRDHDAEGALLTNVMEKVSAIVKGDMDPLQVLFSNDILERFYHEGQWSLGMKDQIKAFIQAIAHKSPGLSLIEIGGGTGGMTSVVLDGLRVHDHPASMTDKFVQYIFTDISPAFFVQTKKKFTDPRVGFRTLDISYSPESQGFTRDSFDIVIASNVLHATPNMEDTLQSCRSLLKRGGKLIIHENMDPSSLRMGFVFGLLPGWWLGREEYRLWGPLLSRANWNSVLRKTGFSGEDLFLEGKSLVRGDNPMIAVLVSTRISESLPTVTTLETKPHVKVIYEPSSQIQSHVWEHLQCRYTTTGSQTYLESVHLENTAEVKFTNSVCIFLPDIEGYWLKDMNTNRLSIIKRICSQAKVIIWACARSQEPNGSPTYALAKGLARTIESENLDISFVTITFHDLHCPNLVAHHIWTVLEKNPTRTEKGYENEFVEKNDVLHIPRLVNTPSVTESVYSDQYNYPLITREWQDETRRPLRLTIGTMGLIDTLTFEEVRIDSTELSANEIELRVTASGVNFKDILTALGQVNDSYFGNEFLGIVNRTGAGVTTGLKTGDTVIGVHTGTMATLIRCQSYQLQKLPSEIPPMIGAALPLVYCTAYYSLITWARAQLGESILIHCGTGGVGQAAIQLSNILGLTIFTTTSTNEKTEFPMDRYGIPRHHIFSSRSLEFGLGVRRVTGGIGVDIVLNSLSGEFLRTSWEVLAPFGRFIELGKKDIHSMVFSALGGLPMQPFADNAMFASVDVPSLYKTRDRISDILSAIVKLASEGKITAPQPLQIFKSGEIDQAFRLMKSGKHIGKILIKFSDNDLVLAKRIRTQEIFDAKATYVLAGGLGGISRSICKWMVGKGARNIILISRSKVQNGETQSFLAGLRSNGAKVVTPSCDVGDIRQIEATVQLIKDTMPPIKGCIQAAMVLRNVTAEDWTAVTRPKVDGSWNLNALLPKGRDFFIILSSHSNLLGALLQSNYAAGNAFQDELARYRVERGENALSIDLGSMTSIEYLASHSDAILKVMEHSIEDFSEEELLALLEHYCDKDFTDQGRSDVRTVTPVCIPTTL